jgi:hypothetical protein
MGLNTKYLPTANPFKMQQGKHKCPIGPYLLHSMHDPNPGESHQMYQYSGASQLTQNAVIFFF